MLPQGTQPGLEAGAGPWTDKMEFRSGEQLTAHGSGCRGAATSGGSRRPVPCAPVALVGPDLAETSALAFHTPVFPLSPGPLFACLLSLAREVLAPGTTSQPGPGGLLRLSLRQPPRLPFPRDRCAPL